MTPSKPRVNKIHHPRFSSVKSGLLGFAQLPGLARLRRRSLLPLRWLEWLWQVTCVVLLCMLSAHALSAQSTAEPAQGGGDWDGPPQIPSPQDPFTRVVPTELLRSGSTFISNDLRSMQQSDDLNPGFLWWVQGEALWSESASPQSPSCASCHGANHMSMRGVSTHYPKWDESVRGLINLESRINLCRTRYQHLKPLKLESDQMLGITAYVASASRGLPMDVHIDERSMSHFLQGRSLYYKRMGQINLACTHCHEQNWGSKLQGETISQGHVNNYPVYRLEWQRMGSLHRRIRACLSGVRAYMFELGSEQMLDLELFLSWRSSDPKILIESPGVRR